MNYEYDPSIRLNERGDPDLAYYVTEARRLQRVALSEIGAHLAQWLARALGFSAARPVDAA